MRKWNLWLPVLILVCAASLRYSGFDRPMDMHPDEPQIVQWMNRVDEDGYLKHTAYPGGFFALFKQFKRGAGIVVGAKERWEYFQGKTDRMTDPRGVNNYILGRHFNIWLACASCVLVYFLAYTVSGSPAAGLFSALLLCFAPQHVTHSHYVQTDIAMVFTLTLTLWLWALFARRGAWWIFAAAALSAGFAAGTKFTLACLLPLGVIFSFYQPVDKEKRRNWRIIPLFVVGSVLLFVLGFLIANRAAWNWPSFWDKLQWGSERVYGEGVVLQGQARGIPFLRIRSHWLTFYNHPNTLRMLGIGVPVAVVLGLFASFFRPWRRFWPVLIGFPVVYFYYYVFKSPWVRTQEFMGFLPSFFILAGLAPVFLWRNRNRVTGRVCAILLCIICLVPIMRIGLLASSQFKWKDSRHLARRWLQCHLPFESSVGLERYTIHSVRDIYQDAEFIYKIETAGPDVFEKGKFDYVMRNPSSPGRGIFHPLTWQRYPDYQANLDNFTNRATRLHAFGALPPDSFKTCFTSPDQELWGLAEFTPEIELQLPLTQPFRITDAGRDTFFQSDSKIGSAEAVLIDKYPRQYAFGGPAELNRPVFIIANTLERQTEFRLRGFGRRFNTKMDAYQAELIPLQRPFWRPRLKLFETINVSTKHVPHIVYVPCLLRPAFNASDAALYLRQTGHDHQALDLLKKYPRHENSEYATALIYPLATALGQWDLADEWAPSAELLHANLAQALELQPEQLRVNGASGYFHNQFARVRFYPHNRVFDIALRPEDNAVPESNPALPPGSTKELPVRLARGCYEVTVEVRPNIAEDKERDAGSLTVLGHCGAVLAQSAWQARPADFTPVRLGFRAGTETGIKLHFASDKPCVLEYRNLEVRWNIHDQIRSIYNEITAARAAHYLNNGQSDRALAVLAEAAWPAWNGLELKRLKVTALQAAQEPEHLIADAARDLLKDSPRYFPALQIVDPESAGQLEDNIPQRLNFPPFLALVAVHTVQATPEFAGRPAIELVFESLTDDMPRMAAALHTRRRRGWRTQAKTPFLPAGAQNLRRGERVRVRFEPGEYLNAAPDDFGLSVLADVKWSPGTIRPENRSGLVVPLARISHRF